MIKWAKDSSERYKDKRILCHVPLFSRFCSPLAVRLLETNNNDNRFHSFETHDVPRILQRGHQSYYIVSWQEYLALSNEQKTSKTLLRANEKLLYKVLINTHVHTHTYTHTDCLEAVLL